MHKHTDPRQADALSKVILAENAIEEVRDQAINYSLTLPDLSRHALLDSILGVPLPAALPAYEAAEFRKRYLDRIARHQATVDRFGAFA